LASIRYHLSSAASDFGARKENENRLGDGSEDFIGRRLSERREDMIGVRQFEHAFDWGVLRDVRAESREIVGKAIGNHPDAESTAVG